MPTSLKCLDAILEIRVMSLSGIYAMYQRYYICLQISMIVRKLTTVNQPLNLKLRLLVSVEGVLARSNIVLFKGIFGDRTIKPLKPRTLYF